MGLVALPPRYGDSAETYPGRPVRPDWVAAYHDPGQPFQAASYTQLANLALMAAAQVALLALPCGKLAALACHTGYAPLGIAPSPQLSSQYSLHLP